MHTLLAHDRVDVLHLLVYPLTLGSGKRLFPQVVHRSFALTQAVPYPTGVVSLTYQRVAPAGAR